MMTDRRRDQEELQAAIGYTFRDGALLRAALTHSSYAHEKKGTIEGDNERLEFLGDAVIGLAAARYLCEQFPAAEEGELTRGKLVQGADGSTRWHGQWNLDPEGVKKVPRHWRSG